MITTKGVSNNYEFSLLEVEFTRKMNKTQNWAFNIRQKIANIQVGICLKSIAKENNFSGAIIDWRQPGYGYYLIGSDGWCDSHSSKEFNRVNKSFLFGVGDMIFVEYDPIGCRLRFRKN